MAKYEKEFKGEFNEFVNYLEKQILKSSSSSSLEDQSNYKMDTVNVAVRVFERYSVIGSNRVSLNITIIGKDDDIHLSAITSGGSQAVFLKINTVGEFAFLDIVKDSMENYLHRI